MIRTLLASPWLPLMYWAAALIAVACGVHRGSLGRGPVKQIFSTSPQTRRFWYPQYFVLQSKNSSVPSHRIEIVTNKAPTSMEAQPPITASITMLSICADPPERPMTKTLAIQCRTSVAISNARGRSVTIHGVVTQEVVSSSGKILIMAGSRVVGSGLLDPENGRIKSDGLWSVYFDNTELKVQAELLDRPSGLPGILGHEMSNQDPGLLEKPLARDSRSIVVPRNAPFVLELHGEILLRDLQANEVWSR